MLNLLRDGRTWLAGVVIAFAAAGCAEVPPETIARPGMDIRAVAIAEVDAPKMEWERSARWARRSLAGRLRASRAFDAVLDPMPSSDIADGSIVVRGRIVHHETLSGLGALGLGFGDAEMLGRFRIEDRTGRLLAAFDVAVDADKESIMPARDMAQELGEDAGGMVAAWVRRERTLLAAASRRQIHAADTPATAN